MENLTAKIIEDRQSGLSYSEIMKKYNLKSNWEIKKALGKELGNRKDYINITISKKKIAKLSDNDLSSIFACLGQKCFNSLECKGLVELKTELLSEILKR